MSSRSRRTRFVFLFVSTCLTVLVWWLRCAGEGSRPEAEPEAADAGVRAAAIRPRDPEGASRKLAFQRALGSISGTITEPGGRPLAGASVCAWFWNRDAPRELMREPRCTNTLANGHYRLADLPPLTVSVGASAERHRPATWQGTRRDEAIDLRPGEHRTGVDLVLAPGGVDVRGIVRDISGGVVEGAIVTVISHESRSGNVRVHARSDAEGRFVTWVVDGDIGVYATAEGYGGSSQSGMAPGPTFELFMTPESVVTGRVVFADTRAPVAGAFVILQEWGAMTDAVSDEDGRFRIDRLQPGIYYPSARTDEGFGRTTGAVHVGLAQTSDEIEIAIHPAASISGVLLAGGSPCVGGSVSLADRTRVRDHLGWSDADGHVKIPGLRPGTYHVTARCPGFVDRIDFEPITLEGASKGGQRWALEPGVTLTGTIVDEAGEPIERAHVEASLVLSGRDGVPHHDAARSDATGRFELVGLVPGRYTLDVHARGYLRPEDTITVELGEQGAEPSRVELRRGGAIEGDVVDEHGRPMAGAIVRATGEQRGAGSQCRDDGTFRIEAVSPGRYRVSAVHGGEFLRAPGASDDDVRGESVSVAANAVATVHLLVESRDGRIAGHVVDASGRPISDAFIDFMRESESAAAAPGRAASVRWGGWERRPELTDENGSFQREQLAQGRYTLRAYRKGGGEAIAEHVEVGSTGILLRLTETGSIAGKVVRMGGGVPEEFTVQIRDLAKGYRQLDMFYKTDGAFVMTEVPAGEFDVAVTSIDGDGSIATTLGSGQVRSDLVIELVAKIDVRGRVVDLDTGEPIAGLHVAISPRKGMGGVSFAARADDPSVSDDTGRFLVEQAPAGPVRIRIAPRSSDEHAYGWTTIHRDLPAGGSEVDLGDLALVKPRRKSTDPAGDLGFKLKEAPPTVEAAAFPLTVAFVRPRGPAAAAGLSVGDVIMSVDGHDVIGNDRHHYGTLTNVEPGTKLVLGLEGGRTLELVAATPP